MRPKVGITIRPRFVARGSAPSWRRTRSDETPFQVRFGILFERHMMIFLESAGVA